LVATVRKALISNSDRVQGQDGQIISKVGTRYGEKKPQEKMRLPNSMRLMQVRFTAPRLIFGRIRHALLIRPLFSEPRANYVVTPI
jgi:hypothetical protein